MKITDSLRTLFRWKKTVVQMGDAGVLDDKTTRDLLIKINQQIGDQFNGEVLNESN